ncbi:hypothetical protein SHIRM173S_00536 [Streptomyces hirsutus]
MRGYVEAARLVQDAGDGVGGEVLAAVRVVGIGVGGATDGHGVPYPFLDQLEPRPQMSHVGGHGFGVDGRTVGHGDGFGGVRHGWRSPLRRRRAGAGPRSRGPAKPPSGPGSVASL